MSANEWLQWMERCPIDNKNPFHAPVDTVVVIHHGDYMEAVRITHGGAITMETFSHSEREFQALDVLMRFGATRESSYLVPTMSFGSQEEFETVVYNAVRVTYAG